MKNKIIDIVKKIEEFEKIKISDLLYYTSTQSFNTKGQDLEKYLFAKLYNHFKLDNIIIDLTEKKSGKDIEIVKNTSNNLFSIKGFSLKNYSPNRVQLSTYKKFLKSVKEYREKYKENDLLSITDVDFIKNNIVSEFSDEISIITLYDKKTNTAGFFLLDYNKLLEQINQISFNIKAKNKKTEHIQLKIYSLDTTENNNITIDFGTNPLNRGIWITNIDLYNPPGFLTNVFVKKIDITKYKKISVLDQTNDALSYLERNFII